MAVTCSALLAHSSLMTYDRGKSDADVMSPKAVQCRVPSAAADPAASTGYSPGNSASGR